MNHHPSLVRLLSLLLIVALLLGFTMSNLPRSAEASPQSNVSQTTLSTPQLLDQALADGTITADQRLLYLTYAIYEYASLPVQFRSNAGWFGTEYLREVQIALKTKAVGQRPLSETTLHELSRLLAPTDGVVCDVPDGPNNDNTSPYFFINYDTISGSPLLTLAQYRDTLDAAYATEISSYGWARPPVCPEDGGTCPSLGDRYPVQIATLSGGLYGYVTTGWNTTYAGWIIGDNPNTPEIESESTTSCMVLRDDSYETLGSLAGLRVTSAHEFKHAIQNGYGDTGSAEDLIWWEGDAAYSEDEVWDSVNDNYQYLWPDWTQCLGEWPTGAPSYPEYSSWLLFRYAAEHNGGVGVAGGGEDVVQGVWQNIAAGQRGLDALDAALGSTTPGATLAGTFHDYAIASRFQKACPDSDPYCYQEAVGYVSYAGVPNNDGEITSMGESYAGSIRDNYAINWVGLPTTGGPYNVTLSNTSPGGQLRGSIVADPTGDETGILDVTSFPTVVNTGESRSMCYTPPGGSDGVVAVITNQFQTAANPASCTFDGYTMDVTAASDTGSLANLPMGDTVDIGCGTYVKARRNTGDPGTVTAIKHATAPGGNPAGPGEMPLWWDITASGPTYNVDLTLCYTDAELAAAGTGVAEGSLVLFRNTDGGPTWTEEGADARDTTANCVTKNGVTALSNWTLGMPGAPTAINLHELAANPIEPRSPIGLLLPLALLGIVGSVLMWKRRQTR